MDLKKIVQDAETGLLGLLKVLKEDPIYGGRLKNIKTKEMSYERKKFLIILDIGRTAYRLYFKNRITQPELLALCKKLQVIDAESKIYHGTERRWKNRK
ncbi:MAG: hypothetical protein BWY26_00136 [Elusimicrobia bacterium ADurb.Bin231]|nr:MAG: hypothetical protein BWY26_00136 [Elusimicrobia bacterium ADurb.Bin231]